MRSTVTTAKLMSMRTTRSIIPQAKNFRHVIAATATAICFGADSVAGIVIARFLLEEILSENEKNTL